jgi:hypothetical protein
VKYEDRGADGILSYPYGENPVGYFVYDATGHVSVHIMRTPPLKSFPGMREGTGEGAAYRRVGTHSERAESSTRVHAPGRLGRDRDRHAAQHG